MGLVYLITGLPKLRRGDAPPLARADFVARCRDELSGADLAEFERLLRLESVEETVRLSLAARLSDPNVTPADINAAVLRDRADGVPTDELPDWLRRPLAQHQLLRRHYFELTRSATTSFLHDWANFTVDVEEIKTAVLCRDAGLSRDAFLQQMLGSFDASAPLIIRHWEDPRLGLGQRFPWLSAALEAMEGDDLAGGERVLHDIQWQRIEALPVPDLFSVETAMAFYLRLRILEREASWDAERGQAVLDRILSLDAPASAAPSVNP